MTVKADPGGVHRLLTRLENLDKIDQHLIQRTKQNAENMRATAQGLVYGSPPAGIQYETGETGDSIDPYSKQTEAGISFGTVTRNLRTIYHELGTGPVGTAVGYSGEAAVDMPIARRSTAWRFWSDSIPTEDGGTRSGFVMTKGVPPKAFMHAATVAEKPLAEKAVQDTVKEFMSE